MTVVTNVVRTGSGSDRARIASLRLSHRRGLILLIATALVLIVDNNQRVLQAHRRPLENRWKFDFGPGPLAPGYRRVMPSDIYSHNAGFGFEPGAQISCSSRNGKDPLRTDFCSAEKPFYFSVAVPEGNYNVTVTLGDETGESITTVKAELRRLMLERVETKRRKFETRTFSVNVRTPKISTGGQVKLKDREQTTEIWAWDEKLTLEFNGARPAVCAVEIVPIDVPTIYLLGDSTVCDQPREPYNSWGQMLTRFFRPGIAIANHAESGESLRSSLGARRLDKVLSTIKPGDYLFIQYGHNDEKEKGEGVGAFTTYKSDLKKFVAGAREHGAMPVLITPVQRRTFDKEGKITNSHGDYPEAMRQVAREENVPLLDLNAMSKTLYEAWGDEFSKKAFAPNDNTHHDNYGSYELAKCLVESIRLNRLPIAKYLVTDVPRFDPSHPDSFQDFAVPASPLGTEVKPPGNGAGLQTSSGSDNGFQPLGALPQESDLALLLEDFVCVTSCDFVDRHFPKNRNDPRNHTNYTKLLATFNQLFDSKPPLKGKRV